MIKKLIQRYYFFIFSLLLSLLILICNHSLGMKILNSAFLSFLQMLSVLPPIMVLLGLLDSWISKETMMKYMGENSGLTGILIAILIGSFAAGPMYASFPFALVLLKKGVKFSNVIIFMNAWCVTKISTLLFEISSLGIKFTIIRFLINFPLIIIIGFLVEYFVSEEDIIK